MLRKITITAEHLPPVVLNIDADRESRDLKDSSEWKLDPQVSNKVCLAQGTPDIDLYASSVSYQITQYTSWKKDPFSKDRDTLQAHCSYVFPLLL